MTQAIRQPIQPVTTLPPQEEATVFGERPNDIRYGWNPYKDINLYNGDGTPYYYIQPANSPFHRTLPKNQLIPFETFNIPKTELVPGASAAPGKPAPVQTIYEVKTALVAATELLGTYSGKGYIVIDALQGIPQARADRIFRRVFPFDMKIAEAERDLRFEAKARIKSDEDLIYTYESEDEPDYVVQALDAADKIVAENVRQQMLVGVQRALRDATEILNKTESDMQSRASGGKLGKEGADEHDEYLCNELDRDLPVYIGGKNSQSTPALNPETEANINFLAERERNRAKDEEIERLKAELAEAKSQTEKVICDYIKDDQTQCKAYAVTGGVRCNMHRDK